MKNTIYTLLLVSIFTILIGGKCRKEHTPLNELPPATQTGANTMGCLIDGKPWLPDTRDNGSTPRLPQISIYLFSDTTIDIGFNRNRNGDNQRIRIFLKSFYGIGDYILNKKSDIRDFPPTYGFYESYGAFIDYNSNKLYSTSSLSVGIISITHFDKQEKIISGTFNFKAKATNTSDSIILSDGRFDCKFN